MPWIRAIVAAVVVFLPGLARAQAEVLILPPLVLDAGLSVYDVGVALFDGLPSRAYAVTEIAIAVPQVAIGIVAMSQGAGEWGGIFAFWGGALGIHGLWRLTVAEEAPVVPTVTPGGVGLAGFW